MIKNLFFLLFPITAICQVQVGTDIITSTPSDGGGYSTSLSSDGNILAVGSPGRSIINPEKGIVRIYKYESGQWKQWGNDLIAEEAGSSFGLAMSLSADGKTIAVGAPRNSGNGYNIGHVCIFQDVQSTWVQIGHIDGKGSADWFGGSVSLSGDGTLLAIGATQQGKNVTEKGYVQIYKNVSGVWTQLGDDLTGDDYTDNFGMSVSFSANGNRVAVAANVPGQQSLRPAYAKVYELNGSVWSQVGQKVVNGQSAVNVNVKLSGDGTVLAYAPVESSSDFVKVYRMNGTSWQQIGYDIFGKLTDFSISYNGDIIAIGNGMEKYNNTPVGQVRIYQNITGNDWVKIGKNINGPVTNGKPYFGSFGHRVSISHDGRYVAAGNVLGTTRVFDLSSVLSVNHFLSEKFNLYPNPASHVVNIDNSGNMTVNKVDIYDVTGKLINTQKFGNEPEIQLNVETLTTGTYLLHLHTNEGIAVKKLIKK